MQCLEQVQHVCIAIADVVRRSRRVQRVNHHIVRALRFGPIGAAAAVTGQESGMRTRTHMSGMPTSDINPEYNGQPIVCQSTVPGVSVK